MTTRGVSRTVSAAAADGDTSAPSAPAGAAQMPSPRRAHSVQDRHGQTVYVPSADPLAADVGPSATVTPGATATAPLPAPASSGTSQAAAGRARTTAGDVEVCWFFKPQGHYRQ